MSYFGSLYFGSAAKTDYFGALYFGQGVSGGGGTTFAQRQAKSQMEARERIRRGDMEMREIMIILTRSGIL